MAVVTDELCTLGIRKTFNVSRIFYMLSSQSLLLLLLSPGLVSAGESHLVKRVTKLSYALSSGRNLCGLNDRPYKLYAEAKVEGWKHVKPEAGLYDENTISCLGESLCSYGSVSAEKAGAQWGKAQSVCDGLQSADSISNVLSSGPLDDDLLSEDDASSDSQYSKVNQASHALVSFTSSEMSFLAVGLLLGGFLAYFFLEHRHTISNVDVRTLRRRPEL
jgi:hypothetical protein